MKTSDNPPDPYQAHAVNRKKVPMSHAEVFSLPLTDPRSWNSVSVFR